MTHLRMRLLRGVLGLMALAALATSAQAHPHVWITVETTVAFANGAFTGVQHKWTFDEFYTAMAIEGLDKNKDGKYDREELAELAKVNIDGLKDFAYFTYVALAGQELKLGEARDYWLEHKDGLLSLHFTLPFAQPVLTEAKGLTFSVQDPTFFIAFELAKTDPVKLGDGAPRECKINPGAGTQEPGTAAAPGTQSAMQPAFAMGMAKTIAIECGGP
jgi:ABC-type uncharacterized transport system substrate-binding protein